ncbi:MAG: lysophospholipid acyltransferase family protein [Ignavibacteriaceae bacterium]
MKIELKDILDRYYPQYLTGYPRAIKKIVYLLIEKVLYLSEINDFLEKHEDKTGLAFNDEILEYLNFSYVASKKDRDKIPSEGRLICVSNHPLGGIDGCVLVKMISEVRPDVKIVVNDIVKNVENLNGIFLTYNIDDRKIQRKNIQQISRSLLNEEAIIIFPAGEVSRPTLKGIKDTNWKKGALFLSKKFNAPVLPVYVKAKNSFLFYLLSVLNKKLSTILLPHEIFNKNGKSAIIKIGDPIPSEAFNSNYWKEKYNTKLLKKHVLLIGKEKNGIFKTNKNIISPISRKVLIKQLDYCELLGTSGDNKKIYHLQYDAAPDVVTEIARLREITFRKVGEGTGQKIDIDKYDRYYHHIILWDEKELEIAGAYRLALCRDISYSSDRNDIYTSSLFKYTEDLIRVLPESIELGRSFVQAKYWNTNALDSLWQGIGLFINIIGDIKYLYGAVSISNKYPEEAKSLIVYFYKKWFSGNDSFALAKNKYFIPEKVEQKLNATLTSASYTEDLQMVKKLLKIYSLSIPVLFKQYTELCEEGGVNFSDFCIDYNFQSCIDGFIFIKLEFLKESKKRRYKLYMKQFEIVDDF